MNVVVVGEGPRELGHGWNKRDPFLPVPNERLGALEALVERVAKNVYERDVQIIGLPRLRSHQGGKPHHVALAEAIKDPQQLNKLLGASFAATSHAAEAAVIACDKGLENKVGAALRRVLPGLGGPVTHLIFDPEFEVLFFEKQAVERAGNLPACQLGTPPDEDTIRRGGQAKEAFAQWLKGHCNPDAAFLKRVAQELSLPGNRWALKKVCDDLGKLFGLKKGPPAGDQIS